MCTAIISLHGLRVPYMQACCRSSLNQKKSSSHVQDHTDSPPVLGDGKLEGPCQWKVFHVSPHSSLSGVHSCMLVM